MDLYTPPSVAYGGAYAIRPYDWVRAILRNTDAILQLGTCGPSKNYPVFVPFGADWWAYAIRPYDRVRASLQKTVPFLSPTGPLVGRMQYAPTTGYVRSFEISMRFPNWVRAALQKTILFSSPSGPLVGRMQYVPTTGYVRSFEIPMGSLDWRHGGVWEVGRWGLPLAGETGVNEFGEEEDDDQDYNNKGA